MDITRPFIRLPFAFDADRLADEVNALPESAWMQHPSRLAGNSAAFELQIADGGHEYFVEPALAFFDRTLGAASR